MSTDIGNRSLGFNLLTPQATHPKSKLPFPSAYTNFKLKKSMYKLKNIGLAAAVMMMAALASCGDNYPNSMDALAVD